MRILQTVDRVDDSVGGGGGMQLVVLATTKQLADRGHDVTVLADIDSSNLNSRARFVRQSNDSGVIRYILGGYTAAARMQAEEPFDVVHSHFAFASLGPRLALRRAVRRVRTYHGSWDLEGFVDEVPAGEPVAQIGAHVKKAARFAIDAIDLAASDHVVALSTFAQAQAIRRFGLSEQKFTKIPGGVDHERFVPKLPKAAYRAKLGIAPNGPLLFAAGRLLRRKGFDQLIGAMPAVLAHFPDAVLLVGGDGPERAALARLTERLGLTASVRLLGYLDTALPDYYRAADVFVVPSQSLETFGLVTIEALASGTLVLGSRVGATPEILRDLDERLIARDGSPRALAEAIVAIFSESWRHRYPSQAIVDFVSSRYSWERHVDALERLYIALCTTSAARTKVSQLGGFT